MRIDAEWLLFDDGIVRPVIRGLILTGDGSWQAADARAAVFRGQFAAATEVDALDINVLGRDITGLFAVIVDQPGDVVCLLGQRHRYTIEQT